VLGTAILANTVLGYVAEATGGWDMPFVLLIVGCVCAIFFMALTYKEEQYLVADRKGENIEKK
jgi:OPA family glycerol-3-phosphate transporter-like MFS transporter